ncbi:hypothetical protein [Caballeronia terrestris]|uniref:hypothetical protein n=1 Tax=Caballeronia terrestris TaxID=1226301 RepID=UPI000F739AD8|nr:hypothetical protein [Caballeronia terrestris]
MSLTTPKETKRFTVVINPEAQVRLSEFAKQGKLSQGQVSEVLIERADVDNLATAFKARRQDKVKVRATKKVLCGALEKLTPAQRKLLEQFHENDKL